MGEVGTSSKTKLQNVCVYTLHNRRRLLRASFESWNSLLETSLFDETRRKTRSFAVVNKGESQNNPRCYEYIHSCILLKENTLDLSYRVL